MRRVPGHTVCQQPKSDAAVAKAGHDVEQLGQRAAEMIKSPHHKPVVGLHKAEIRLEAKAVITHAGRLALEPVTGIDADGSQSIALQGYVLPATVEGDVRMVN